MMETQARDLRPKPQVCLQTEIPHHWACRVTSVGLVRAGFAEEVRREYYGMGSHAHIRGEGSLGFCLLEEVAWGLSYALGQIRLLKGWWDFTLG